MTEHVRVPCEAAEVARDELDSLINKSDALEEGSLAMTPLARARKRIAEQLDCDDDHVVQALDIIDQVGEETGAETSSVDPLTDATFRARDAFAAALEGGDGPWLSLIYRPLAGPARRVRLTESPAPTAVAALEEAEHTGCNWRTVGREELRRVQIDGVAYHGSESGVFNGP